MAFTEEQVKNLMPGMLRELQSRAPKARLLDRYYEDTCSPPEAIRVARVTRAYKRLMPIAGAPWASVPVDSVQDRLTITGIRCEDNDVSRGVWDVWQRNYMDAESLIAHNASLIAGRSFALVWRQQGQDVPEISLDNAEQMIIKYRPGSRRQRVAALRYWEDDGRCYCTLYEPDGVWKFQEARPTERDAYTFNAGGRYWRKLEVDGEDFPLANPWGVVPVVEIPVNRRLKAGSYGHARGEFEHCLGLIDRINLLTFLGLVVAFWMGFPLRGVIGDKILRNDAGDPIAPFDVHADELFQLENPEAKIAEYKAADRGNLSIYAELDQFATITKTPRHYFPLSSGMSNLSADAIRASEGSLIAKVPMHHGSIGEGWEEVLRLSGLMLPAPIILPANAQLLWGDHQTRSLAERADAATKLKDTLPWQAIAELVLNATTDDISRWEAMRSSDAFGQLLNAAATPTPPAPAIS